MLIKLFNKAGATGHVFYLRSGHIKDMGVAYSGLVGPRSTIAIVPTIIQTIDFSVEARTKDKQIITVTGDIKVSLDPKVAVKKFDFTVDKKNGSHLSDWGDMLRSNVTAQIIAPIHKTANELDIERVLGSHQEFQEAVLAYLTSEKSKLGENGIAVDSCSVATIEAQDEDVTEAIGSTERQQMLAASDAAIHRRRLAGAANDRAVKKYEAATALGLEKDRKKLVDEQIANRTKEAKAEADAIRESLAPFADAEPGKALVAAIMQMARTGRVANLSIVPEILAALGQK